MQHASDTYWGVVLITAVICGAIGAVIGKPKGYEGLGLALGLLLSLIGIIVIALMPESPQVRDQRARIATPPELDTESQLRTIEDLARRGQISEMERTEARRAILTRAASSPAKALSVAASALPPVRRGMRTSYWVVLVLVLTALILVITSITGRH